MNEKREEQLVKIERLNRHLYWIWCCVSSLVLVRVLWGIVANYRSYFPPDFEASFLIGRETHFHGLYKLAFYTHIIASPFSVLFGLLLISSQFRRWSPRSHRFLGRLQIAIVCMLIAPSGLMMSAHALGGWVAGMGFACLSACTATSALFGWRLAIQGRFRSHQRWMWRCWLLLCSAIALRLLTMLTDFAELDPLTSYRIVAWASWLLPLGAFELLTFQRSKE
ncbi:MAG: DUF2306 domain-containing protein [Pirellula sp.]